MDALAGYDSSPDRLPTRPPPPRELNERPVVKRRRVAGALPAVVPVLRSEERYLVHLRLPIVHTALGDFVKRLLGQARLGLVGGKVKAAFTQLEDLHVSVSRPATVRSELIGVLVSDLNKALARCEQLTVAIRRCVVSFSAKNQRRLFVAAPLTKDAADTVVTNVITLIDKVFERHGLPVFFEDPKPHMSFAWTESVEVEKKFTERAQCTTEENVLEVPVNKVVCSIGKSVYYFTLR